MDGGSPVITRPCPQQVSGSTSGKSRRSWFTFSPHQVAKEDEDLPVLQLTHFTKKVMVCFDKVRLGASKTCQLSIENPCDFEQELMVDKFPYKKGFTIPEDRWEFDEMETRILPITWTPSKAGNVRELVTFKCDGAFRLQVILLGTAEEKPQKGKRRRGTLLLKKTNGNVSKAPGKVGGPRRLEQPRAQQQAPKSTARPKPLQRVVGKENFRRPKEPDMLKEVLNPARQTMIISSKRPLVNGKENVPSIRKPDMLKDTQDPARQTMIISKRLLVNGKENALGVRKPEMLKDTLDPARQTMIIKKKPCSPQRSPLQERNSLSPFKPLDSSLAEITNTTSPEECPTKRDTLLVCEGMSPLLQTSYVYFGDINEKSDEPDGAQEVFNDSLDPVQQDPMLKDIKPQSTLTLSPTHTDQGSQKRLSKEAQLTVTKESPPPITPPMKRQSRRTLFDDEECDRSVEDDADLECGDKVEISTSQECQEVSGSAEVQCAPENKVAESDVAEACNRETEVEDHPDSGSDGQASSPESLKSQDSLESVVVSSSLMSLASLPAETDNIFPVHESTARKKLVAKRLSDPKSPPNVLISKNSPQANAKVPSPTATFASVPSPTQNEADLFSVHESVVTKNLTNKRKSDLENPDNRSSKKMKAQPSTGATARRKPVVSTTSKKPVVSATSKKPAVTKKQPVPSATAAKKAANDSKKATMTSAPSRGMTRTMMLRRAAAGVTTNVSKPKPFKTKRPMKGVPMAKLNLVKPNKTALPRHPMPFAAKNMFYDECWMEKQEQGFTRWLNYVLTPDVDDCPKDPSCKATKIDPGALFVEANQQITVALAPSKEDLSLRAYTARRKLNRLRRAACMLFQSEPVIRVIQKVEYEVERGGLKIRPDLKIHADFGIKQKLLNLFLSYNPLWLRIGLETVYGEILPIQSNTDVLGLSRFVVQRLLWNPDTAQKYAHPTVPGLYGPGHEEALGQFTLKKFLLLIFFLDRAKLARLIDHDPCLFCKDSEYKSSRSMLLDFSRDYLQGEGDVTKHLSYYGYVVTHKQTALDEFDFAVDNLSTSLRCGVRLARVVELLTHNWKLSSELRVPAISRLQKIHNTGVALKALKEHSIDVEGGGVNTRAIVDGHREKTLELLWRIIFHFQVEVMLNENQIKKEIAFLKKNLKLQHDLNAMETTLGKTDGMLGLPWGRKGSIEPNVYFKSHRLSLLLQWAQTVCRFYNLQVGNFTVSFSDGRALCYLVHHYHPSLLALKDIRQETTQTQYQRPESPTMSDADDSFDGTWANSYSPSTGKPGEYERLLANERHNYKILYEKVRELGGIPMMIKSTEMVNTIPDEKVVIVYISYLCARLLDLRTETRAARTIQLKWRAYRLKKRQEERKIQIAAAIKIQGAVREFLTRRCHARIMPSVIRMQALVRGKMARKEAQRLRQERLMKRQTQAAIILQRHIKGFLQQTSYRKLKASTILLQSTIRGHLVRRHLCKQHNAASVIQTHYRAYKLALQDRSQYLNMKSAAIAIQSIYRGRLARNEACRMRAARTIQARWRGYVTQRAYSIKKYSAVTIQAWYRMCMVRQEYLEIQKSALILQRHIRVYLFRKQQVRAATTLQALVRGFLVRQQVRKMNHCATCIQSNVRAYLVQKRYQDLKQATRVLQMYWRASLVARQQHKSYQISKGACITIQAWARGVLVRQHMKKMHHAATCIQASYRAHREYTHYQMMKKSAMVLQTYWRATLVMKQQARDFLITRGAVITIQACLRGFLVRQQMKKMHRAATCIQANFRCHRESMHYQKMKKSAVVLQTYWRAMLAAKQQAREYQITRGAVITMQACVRGFLVRQQVEKMNHAATCIQANHRCHKESMHYQKVKKSAVVLQTHWRAMLAAKQQAREYQTIRGTVITMQACVRGFLVRQEVKKMNHAATCIQANYRCHRDMVNYQKMKKSAITLQTYWRSTLEMKQQRQQYQITRGAVITMQAWTRGFLVRQELKRQHVAAVCIQTRYRAHLCQTSYQKTRSACVALQTYWRATMLARRQSADYQTTRNACIVIQAYTRGVLIRKEMRRMHAAAIRIQSNFRAHKATKEYRLLKKSAQILQVYWKATLSARQQVKEYQTTRNAAIAIQAWVRGYNLRKQLKQMNAAATCIQSNYRAHRQLVAYRKLCNSAMTIQVRWRATLSARREVIRYQISRGACITIQAWVRGCLTRRHVQQMHVAATCIQSNFRCYQARTHYQQKRKAAMVLQVRWRALLGAREQQMNYTQMKNAAILIQAAFRGRQARDLACKERAARTIQAVFRMHVARSAYLEQKQSAERIQAKFRAHRAQQAYLKIKSCAIIIQKYYRGLQETRQVQARYAHTRKSVIKIQSTYRMYVARKSYVKLQKAAIVIQAQFRAYTTQKAYQAKKQAAIAIQNYYRGILLMRQIQSGYIDMKKAAIVIQAYYRMYVQYREYQRLKQATVVLQAYARGKAACTEYKQMKHAAVVIQTRYRATLVARQKRCEFQYTRGAIITIQALYRGYRVRKQLHDMEQAAKVLQRHWRATLLAKRTKHEYESTKDACVTLQAAVRGFLLRKQLKKMRNAAMIIQVNYRCHRDQVYYQKMKKSAVVLQTYWRARLVMRQQAREYQITRGAVITVQAFVRGFLVRQQVKKMNQAATCIQANYKCQRESMHYQKMKKSAVVLQTYWRAMLAAKQQAREYQITRGAVITVQAFVRGFLVRQQVKKMHHAATCIQANFRCHRDMANYQKMKKSAVVLQTYWRATLAAKQHAKEFQITRGAVITIQAWVRGFLVRQQVKKRNCAATCIQASYRCHRDYTHYQNLKTSTLILQTYWRARSQMKQEAREYQITRGAVITMQAWARGFLVRQELKRQHAAAVCIQAFYRARLASRSYQQTREAAILLQKYWRAKMLARRLADEYHLVRSSCITIQANIRGFLVRCQVKKMNSAATCIQANYRAHLLSRRYQTMRKSAGILQTYWRATLFAQEQQRQYQATREQIIKIQALMRGCIVRQEIKKMNAAAVCIQSNFRAQRDRTIYQKMRQSAQTIQVHWRATLLARREMIKYQISRGACITIQAWVRGCLTRRQVQQMHAAATCIQSYFKCHLAHMQYQEMKRAAIVLQTRWKAELLCREQQNAFIELKKAAVVVQAVFRGKQSRCAAHKERCARTIQAAYRMHIARDAYLKKKQTAILIQANYRAHVAQQEYQRMRTAALKIQQHYRALLKMREVKQEFEGTKDSVVKIQSTFRMCMERKAFLMKKQAAVRIQAAFRMHRLREKYRKQKTAAVVIQRYYRNVLLTRQTRRDFVHIKESVVKIQSQYRMFVQHKKYVSIKKATSILQAYARGKAARSEYLKLKHAGLVIQTRYRATCLARQQQLKYQYTKGAIVTLQALFRGYKARKLARQIRAVRTIQASYKGCVERQKYLRLKKCVILVQAVFRGNHTRAALAERKRQWSAAMCIQRAYRGFVARRTFEALKAARAAQVHRFSLAALHYLSALKIQRTYRNYHMRQLAKQKMNFIIYIQKWWRAKLERIHFTRLRRGTVLLQRAVRAHQKIRNQAAVVLQSYARVWLAKQYVKKMKDSAQRIQCMWRGFKVRNSIKSKKIAIARARVKAANAAATEEKKLCNRTTSALDYLLQYKDMSYILEALMDLDVVTRLSPTCCERLVAHKAVPVIYTLIRSCNRSQPCRDVIKYCVSILLNLVKYPATTHAVFDVPESVSTILDLMQMYREKGTIIFCQVCLLLGTLSHDPDRAKTIRAMPRVTEKINSIHRLTERKHKMDSKRIAAKTRSLNASRLNSSFLNSSRLNCSVIPGTTLKRRRVQPDWVLGRDRMREINDPIHAVKFLMDSLGLLHK